MIILKFGGTSVSTKLSLELVCAIVASQRDKELVVVVSALSGITNLLVSLRDQPKATQAIELRKIGDTHQKLIYSLWKVSSKRKRHCAYVTRILRRIDRHIKKPNWDKKKQDALIAYGEILSSYIVSCFLTDAGIKSRQMQSSQFIVTDTHFGDAKYFYTGTRIRIRSTLLPLIQRKIVPVVMGFVGRTVTGQITTLGRGGSDYTASILGRCLDADEIQLWSDVSGLYSTDPRKVSSAKPIARISYRVAETFARCGAKVLYYKALQPAKAGNIPIVLKNTFRPTDKGTRIENLRAAKNLRIIGLLPGERTVLYDTYFCIGDHSFSRIAKKEIESKLFQLGLSNLSWQWKSSHCFELKVKTSPSNEILQYLHNELVLPSSL